MKITKIEAQEVLIRLVNNDIDCWGGSSFEMDSLKKRHSDGDIEKASEFLYALKEIVDERKQKERVEREARWAKRNIDTDLESKVIL